MKPSMGKSWQSSEDFYTEVLGDRRYYEHHKFPKWNTSPTVLLEPRLFHRVFPELTKGDHVKLAAKFKRRGERVSRALQNAIIRDEVRFGSHGSLISGGFRDHWPDHSKNTIRRLSHALTLLRSAAAAHERGRKFRGGRAAGAARNQPLRKRGT